MKDTAKTQRVVTFLDRHEIDFLDKLGKDALFYNGIKIPRTKIIEVIIDILSHTHIDIKGIKDEKELKDRILGAIEKLSPTRGNGETDKKGGDELH